MLMMCFFYCIPFSKGLFFAFAPMLILFSLFVLKRGIRQSRPRLRQMAFLLMFLAFLKMFTVDIYFLRDTLLCGIGLLSSACDAEGFKVLQISGFVTLLLLSLGLRHVYHLFNRVLTQSNLSSEQGRIKIWANLSMALVSVLMIWLIAPWIGFLTVGHVPKLFMQVPWQHLAVLNAAILLIGFWKLEDYKWVYDPSDAARKKYNNRVWTAKDTLWLSGLLFLITLAFCYASSDALSTKPSKKKTHIQIDMPDMDSFGPGFRMPEQ